MNLKRKNKGLLLKNFRFIQNIAKYIMQICNNLKKAKSFHQASYKTQRFAFVCLFHSSRISFYSVLNNRVKIWKQWCWSLTFCTLTIMSESFFLLVVDLLCTLIYTVVINAIVKKIQNIYQLLHITLDTWNAWKHTIWALYRNASF